MLVGEDRFRAMVSVAASCVLTQHQTPALISLSLERARFCELLAPLAGENPNEQFMLGLLSLLDAMLETPMEVIVKALPLRPEAKAALMGVANAVGASNPIAPTNPVAVPLNLIRSFESGAWGICKAAADKFGVSEERLASLYVQSVKWANETLTESQKPIDIRLNGRR